MGFLFTKYCSRKCILLFEYINLNKQTNKNKVIVPTSRLNVNLWLVSVRNVESKALLINNSQKVRGGARLTWDQDFEEDKARGIWAIGPSGLNWRK